MSRGVAAALITLCSAFAAWTAVRDGSLAWYGTAAVGLSLLPWLADVRRALAGALVVQLCHGAGGIRRAGTASLGPDQWEVVLLASLVLVAAVAGQRLLRNRTWSLRAGVFVLALVGTLPALTAQRHVFHPVIRDSAYVAMQDGTRLAVDWYLPRTLPPGERLPSVVVFSRYHRATALRFPFNLLLSPSSGNRERFAEAGYATVVVDVRGAGASTGYREAELAPEEVSDYVEIVDWIVRQPWSDGRVGAEGVSYSGTAAELLMLQDHPAVKAIASQYALFDSYSEAVAPGGLMNLSIARTWGQLLEALDLNRPVPGLAGLRKWAWGGVAPVPSEAGTLSLALADHARSVFPHEQTDKLRHRDQESHGHSAFLYSPAGQLDEYRVNRTPLLAVSGWADGGYARGALRKFRNRDSEDTWVVIGPWNHGPAAVTDPCAGAEAFRGRRSDLTLPFFDHYLKGLDNGFDRLPRLRYFTYCGDRWKASDRWPPGDETLQLKLSEAGLGKVSPRPGQRRIPGTGEATSGRASRWRALAALPGDPPTHYADRAPQAAHTARFAGSELADALVVTGNPAATLYLSSSEPDAAVFAYLEDVAPDGTVTYITEAQLRLQHRALSSALWDDYGPVRAFREAGLAPLEPGEIYRVELAFHPVSYRLAAGHRLQLSLAGTDVDNFEPLETPGDLMVHFGPATPSAVQLPLEPEGQRRWLRRPASHRD